MVVEGLLFLTRLCSLISYGSIYFLLTYVTLWSFAGNGRAADNIVGVYIQKSGLDRRVVQGH
jgi:hypothetical protein